MTFAIVWRNFFFFLDFITFISLPVKKIQYMTYVSTILYIGSLSDRLRLSGKQDDSLERQSDSSESWSDILERQEF